MRNVTRVPGSRGLLLLPLLLAACASPGIPPGGPIDHEPPQLVSVSPDTNSVGQRPKEVSFQFDEVINEGGQGPQSLDHLFMISPTDGEPRVGWHRSRVSVRPRHDFRPNMVYVVTMLPGVTDLRGNVRREGATVVFTTGGPIPSTLLQGTIFDWVEGKPTPRGYVEAVSRRDTTLVFQAVSDSSGHFAFPHLPAGDWLVRGSVDVNGNRAVDAREPWDSAGVALRDSARVELDAFVHDTAGPRVQTVALRDSVTLDLTFDRPLDPTQPLDTTRFRLRAADSTLVPIRRVLPTRDWEAENAAAARRADSVRAASDSSRAGRTAAPRADTTAPPRPARPLPVLNVTVVAARPLAPEASYRIVATGVRGLMGTARTSDRQFTTPKPAAPAPTAPAPGAPARRPSRGRP